MTTPETYLKLTRQPGGDVIEFPANSGTYIDCDLSPISSATQLARDVNGNLVNLGDDRFRKYALSLSCSGGVQLPALSNLWPGMEFSVELPVVLKEPGTTPSRDAVEGSVELVGGYVQYRPIMSVMLTRNSLQETEWRGRSSGWSLSFEEIDAEFTDVPVGPVVPDNLVEASGGIEAEYTDADTAKWKCHTFPSTDFLYVSGEEEAEAEILVVGDGGGGGLARGGGGAGGVVRAKIMLKPGLYPIQIGAGGAAGSGNGSSRHGRNGSGSSFADLVTALGGGGGWGSDSSSTSRVNGASGGGANFSSQIGGGGSFPQGHGGGNNYSNDEAGGGGGGAGGRGGDVFTPGTPGDGGPGVDVAFSMPEQRLGGGGAGGDYDQLRNAVGFDGGGSSAPVGSTHGAPNTGGGGAGSGRGLDGVNYDPGNGGSGIVIIRYRIA